MANPFPARFNGNCQDCGDKMFEGDTTYAVDGMFVCSACVPRDNVCACGTFKKAAFKSCYECSAIVDTYDEVW